MSKAARVRLEGPDGGTVRGWREHCGLTQEQAARRLGVTTRTFQSYEADAYEPPETVRRLMTAIASGHDFQPWRIEQPAKGRR